MDNDQKVEQKDLEKSTEVEEESISEMPIEDISKEEENIPNDSEENTIVFFTEDQFDVLKKMLKSYFEAIAKIISNVKSKDESIYNINKDLQKYKNDYYLEICKPLVIEIIQLRESLKKSIEDLQIYEYDKKRILGDIDFLKEQIINVLSVHGVSIQDKMYYYKEKLIHPTQLKEEKKEIPMSQIFEETVDEVPLEQRNFDSFLEILDYYQRRIESLYKTNDASVKTINLLHKALVEQQEVCDGDLIVPILDKIILMLEYVNNKFDYIENIQLDEDAKKEYSSALLHMVTYLTNKLEENGVFVKNVIGDEIDTRCYRILKFIKIDDESQYKDKSIERVVSDCYIYNDRVLYPGKVNIYKLDKGGK